MKTASGSPQVESLTSPTTRVSHSGAVSQPPHCAHICALFRWIGDDQDDMDSFSFFTNEKRECCALSVNGSALDILAALLPAPFLSTQRRARALSQAQPQVSSGPLAQIPNPTQFHTPGRIPLGQTFSLSPGFLNTPPPKPAVLNKYRLRGSVTDPAHTRRRPAFGQVSS